MSEAILYIFLALLCMFFGAFIGNLIAKLKSKAASSTLNERLNQADMQIDKMQEQYQALSTQYEEERKENQHLSNELTKQIAAYDHLKQRSSEQQEEMSKLQEKFTKEFENLANKIFNENSKKLSTHNKESIENILNPLQEKIKTFEKRVEDTHKESIDRHATLRQQIIGLKELNEQMSKEAVNLTRALKGDSKMQGNWGELVLERVLEKSGLEKDREYKVQTSLTTDEGKRVLPDVIIYLPDNKKMIVDSKVTLTAYERYVNEEEDDLKTQYLKDHVAALKRHVEQLSAKNYQNLYQIESPDFVLLFIPIEPAFALAINSETSLYNWAFEKNIVIVTPTTLLATLRTIDSMWNNEKQQRNALEIAKQAGKLYDQFVNLTDDLIKVGKQIQTVSGSYESTMKKLTGRGNLISKVEKLKRLGIKQSKTLNEKLIERSKEEEE